MPLSEKKIVDQPHLDPDIIIQKERTGLTSSHKKDRRFFTEEKEENSVRREKSFSRKKE